MMMKSRWRRQMMCIRDRRSEFFMGLLLLLLMLDRRLLLESGQIARKVERSRVEMHMWCGRSTRRMRRRTEWLRRHCRSRRYEWWKERSSVRCEHKRRRRHLVHVIWEYVSICVVCVRLLLLLLVAVLWVLVSLLLRLLWLLLWVSMMMWWWWWHSAACYWL